MDFLSPINKRRATGLVGACALVLGGIASAVVAGAGAADAATCTGTAAGTPCVITGTADLGDGSLSTTVPGSLTWATTMNGLSQNLFDSTPADEGYVVNDATGSGLGWNVTVSATTFSAGTALGSPALPDTGTFSTTGSITSPLDTTAPSKACTGGPGTCTLPSQHVVAYPVAIPTAAFAPVPVTVYEAEGGTGLGSVNIGGSASVDPVGWWLHVPGSATPGTYTSTITINVVSGP